MHTDPHRSPHTALRQIETHRKAGRLWAYEADIEDCFGSVRPALLSKEIHRVCGDARLDTLILRYVRVGVMQRGAKNKGAFGLPQGSPLSPLLANIYLHPFDQMLVDAGLALVRYADDFIILAESERKAEQAGDQAEEALRQRGMRPNPDKTRIVALHDGISFLGFSIDHRGERPSPKAIQGLQVRLQEMQAESRKGDPIERIANYKTIIQGWRNYFRSFGSFAPAQCEMAIAAAESAIEKGEQEEAQRFLTPFSTDPNPPIQERLLALRQQCGLPAHPSNPETQNTTPTNTSISLTSSAPPHLGEESFLKEAIGALRRFRQEQEQARKTAQAKEQNPTKESSATTKIKQLRHKIHLDPNHVPLYQELAEVYAQSGLYMLAESILKQANERNSHHKTHSFSPTAKPQGEHVGSPQHHVASPQHSLPSTSKPPIPKQTASSPKQPTHQLSPGEKGTTNERLAPDELPKTNVSQALPTTTSVSLPETSLDRYLELYRSREGILAQAHIQGNGKLHYQAVSRHLNEQTLREHLDGKVTYAIFPIDEKGESQIGGLDVDLTQRILRAHMDDPQAMQARLEEAKSWSLQLTHILRTMGVQPLLEESGFKGYHIWFFLEKPMRAKRIRSFLRMLLNQAPEPPAGVVAELIPDRDHLNKHDTGHSIKLPLGIHPGSGKRAFFLSPETGILVETKQALQTVQTTPPQTT